MSIYEGPFLLVNSIAGGVHSSKMDESALSSSIFESLRKCIDLREKYTAIGLQRKQDNPRDYPDLSVATSKDQVSPVKVRDCEIVRA